MSLAPADFTGAVFTHGELKKVLKYVQGQPLGFDTKYLALADRNMQVRFSLKVVWES